MSRVTLQVLEGLERGRTFADLPTPVTLGREEENSVRLNDERVSRFHAKLQEDAGKVILTDLDSTNGTRVNGRPVQMGVLRPGDHLSIGRCLLVFGSRDEIADRLVRHRGSADDTRPRNGSAEEDDSTGELRDHPAQRPFPLEPPGVPEELTPLQRAQLCDLLGHLHEVVRRFLLDGESTAADAADRAKSAAAAPRTGAAAGGAPSSVGVDTRDPETGGPETGGPETGGPETGGPDAGDGGRAREDPAPVRVGWPSWQRLMRLEMDVATALRAAADPDSD